MMPLTYWTCEDPQVLWNFVERFMIPRKAKWILSAVLYLFPLSEKDRKIWEEYSQEKEGRLVVAEGVVHPATLFQQMMCAENPIRAARFFLGSVTFNDLNAHNSQEFNEHVQKTTCSIIREIVGDPFTPWEYQGNQQLCHRGYDSHHVFHEEWVGPEAKELIRQIDQDKEWDLLPLLADNLMDRNCPLDHPIVLHLQGFSLVRCEVCTYQVHGTWMRGYGTDRVNPPCDCYRNRGLVLAQGKRMNLVGDHVIDLFCGR